MCMSVFLTACTLSLVPLRKCVYELVISNSSANCCVSQWGNEALQERTSSKTVLSAPHVSEGLSIWNE